MDKNATRKDPVMKELSETTLCRKLSAFCGSLCHYSVGHRCDLTLSLYADEETETPECTHRFQGSSRHNLFVLIGLVGGVTLMIGLVAKLCSCFGKS